MAALAHSDFEAVIGLEVHCQLATRTKIFCNCPANSVEEGQSVSELAVNAHVCPVCAGHPGTLPVLNRKVVEYAIRVGLATGCRINLKNVFSRKNYFYPDLPKGYQISQFDLPICEKGSLEISFKQGNQSLNKTISIQRIHMEEDAGKNLHMDEFSLVNLNRSGVPLVEIVSGPDMRTAEEAGAYLRSLHQIVTHIGICDGNMQEGNFRCDANVSVMPKGSSQFGTRAEIKNVNSFRFVEKAIEYEIARQIELVKSGGKVIQETRTYDADKGVTISMRSKEEAHDYRYFPEPDLVPLRIDPSWVETIKSSLPELPAQKKARYVSQLGLSAYDAGVITASKAMSGLFEATLQLLLNKKQDQGVAKSVANFITGEVARLLNETGVDIENSQLKPDHLARVIDLTQSGVISSTNAKVVIAHVWKSGDPVDQIVEKQGLKQVSDVGALEEAIKQVIAAHPGQVAEYRSGKEKLLGFFVGQVMKQTGGKANPALLQELVKKILSTNVAETE